MRVSWKNGQAEATKVFIECEARNMIEQRGDHDKREGIAEGEAMITGIAPKYAFGFVSQAVAVGNNLKARFHIMKKGEGRSIIQPVPKQRHRFTDDIPRRTKVVPTEAASVARACARAWLRSLGSRQA
ncbi:MAG: hypothetical protein OJF50_002055 [Nitrospira sp.]|jgi:hypothetical protein|nr:hypothetical protein [Nitrospira sp.]